MTGFFERASVLVWIAAAILLYFVVSVTFFASGVSAMSVMTTGSLIAAVTFLVAAWAWMLYSAVKGARRFRWWAWLVVLFLVGLATIPGMRPVVLPALVLTVPSTFLTWMAGRGAVGGWRWVVVLAVLLLLVFTDLYFGYFGAVLVLIGATRMPPRAGAYLRELFPRSVGGSS